MRSRGLYSKIGLRLGLLLMAAMVLIDVAIFMALQKVLVQQKIADGRTFLSTFCENGDGGSSGAAAVALAQAECLIRLDGKRFLIGAKDCVPDAPKTRQECDGTGLACPVFPLGSRADPLVPGEPVLTYT